MIGKRENIVEVCQSGLLEVCITRDTGVVFCGLGCQKLVTTTCSSSLEITYADHALNGPESDHNEGTFSPANACRDSHTSQKKYIVVARCDEATAS